MNQIRKRLTYANVMSSIAVFLLLGGGAAFAAGKLGKNSVGSKQLKSNSVTAAKIKKNAVTSKKIKNNAVTGAKIKNGAVNGAKVADGSLTGTDINAGTLGIVPTSAKTEMIKVNHGTVSLGQEAAVFAYGPFTVSVKCEVPSSEPAVITAHAYISSSAEHSVFTSWQDGSKDLGPATPLEERELNAYYWADSNGPYEYDSQSDIGVSATAASGQSFQIFVAVASEKDTGTCWFWSNATILS